MRYSFKELPAVSKLACMKATTRLAFTFVITIVIISSSTFMLANPADVSASTTPTNTNRGSATANDYSTSSHQQVSERTLPMSSSPTPTIVGPSTLSQDGSDFTAQATLSSLTARPTNNIVNTNSFYDVVFLTASSGSIKTIQVTFPAGTTIPSGAFFNEAEGIGPGTVSKSGQTITYTVNNVVNVPAGTKIRLEFANINNPLQVSASYQVTVTTRDSANNIIDGPSQSTAYTIKQVGTNAIADNSITGSKMAGINKLIFGICTGNLPSLDPQGFADIECLDPNAQSGDQIVAERSNPRNPPSAVKMNSVALDGLVAFGFENPSATTTASQEGVEISYIIFKKP